MLQPLLQMRHPCLGPLVAPEVKLTFEAIELDANHLGEEETAGMRVDTENRGGMEDVAKQGELSSHDTHYFFSSCFRSLSFHQQFTAQRP